MSLILFICNFFLFQKMIKCLIKIIWWKKHSWFSLFFLELSVSFSFDRFIYYWGTIRVIHWSSLRRVNIGSSSRLSIFWYSSRIVFMTLLFSFYLQFYSSKWILRWERWTTILLLRWNIYFAFIVIIIW